MQLEFSPDFPSVPPGVFFRPCIFHPNIYPSGKVCLSILDSAKDWKPSITLKQVLLGVQDLLDSPNNSDPAQGQASSLLRSDPAGYKNRIRKQAQLRAPSTEAL